MTLSDDAIKGYLIMSCSDKYFTPEVIAGFAKNAVFQEETPTGGWSKNLKERDLLFSELKEDFSLKKIKPILEKLVEENRLEKDTWQVRKRKRSIPKTVYRLPTDESTKSQ